MDKAILTRTQFEILSFIAENIFITMDCKKIADRLYISPGVLLDMCNFFAKKHWIVKKEDIFSITDDGQAVLKPYRVHKAIILGAGFGSRMMPATSNCPKPMVRVRGRRIINTLLDALVAADIKDITIVRGYQKEKFDELLNEYPFIKFIDNDDYDKTNNISSAILAKDQFVGGAYLCEADLYISNPNIITKYQYTSNILGSYSLQTDDWSFKMDDSGHIRDYKKGNTFCWNYYGISYWTAEDCEQLNHDWAEIFAVDTDVFWEQVPLQLKRDKYDVEIRPCRKEDIIEIDNYYELSMLDPSYR